MSFTITPLTHPCAAEITGLDCSKPFTDDVARAVKQAYADYPVLVFRNQTVTAPQFAMLGRFFGPLVEYGVPKTAAKKTASLKQTGGRDTPDQFLYQHPDDPDVLIMTNERNENLPEVGIVDNAEMWHSDASHKYDPYQAIMVHVVRNPASGGGETEFCDLRMIYDALPADVQKTLAGRTAVHHWSKSVNPRFDGTLDDAAKVEGDRIAAMIPPAHQPVVRTHPDTGRPSLYISPRFTLRIDDIPPEASNTLLDGLFGLMDDQAFIYRHEWREGDIMIWDNRCLNHRVCAYDAKDVRCRHRVTIAGDRPFYRPSN